MEHATERPAQRTVLWRWILGLSGTAALVYLVIEHRPHLFGWLPYLIILACPVMHLFGHRGHRHHHDGR